MVREGAKEIALPWVLGAQSREFARQKWGLEKNEKTDPSKL